ncbi:MAG: hypothetical protein WBG10_09845, partial [Pseudolabrys sp.]
RIEGTFDLGNCSASRTLTIAALLNGGCAADHSSFWIAHYCDGQHARSAFLLGFYGIVTAL